MPRYPHTTLFSHPRRTVVVSGPRAHVLDTQTGRILGDVESGLVRCAGMSTDAKYLATTGDDKRLQIWDLESFTLQSSRELAKKPTSVTFSSDMDILVSDKFGDVFRYALHLKDEPGKERETGELILGHASLLTSFLLTPDEKFIITADRDEHIRVSWYPDGYVIESYCLGHKKYVSAIHIPVASSTMLISGGGDPELKVWDWMTGRLRKNINVFDVVEPFIKVVPQGRRRELRDEEDVGDAAQGSNSTPIVFVVRRISSFLCEGDTHVVFSVVGATAIFEFVLDDTHDQPDIWHHDFEKPVIDFTLCDQGLVWVLLDADFHQASDARPHDLVQVKQWSTDQHIFAGVGRCALLDNLNTTCSLAATAEDLEVLDLYSELSSLPKNVEQEPLEDEGGEGLTKRALGRLKHKRALDQLHREGSPMSQGSSS